MTQRTDGRSGPDRRHLDEARRLIAACGGNAADAASIADAVGTACRRATDHLGPLIGVGATQALLARAVFLSKLQFRLLNGVSTAEAQADVARDLPLCLRTAQADEALQAAVSVLGSFVWLLTRFISEDLGLRLLRDACPTLDQERP